MMVRETERLYLRLLELDDINDLMGIWGDVDVMRFCGGAGSKEQELGSLKYYINLHNEKGFSPYAVILKETNTLIGVCGFNPPNNGFDAELMYHFNQGYWGKGYATEAARACLEYAKGLPNLNKIGASIDPLNQSSQKILEKLGFEFYKMVWCEATQQEEPYYIKQ